MSEPYKYEPHNFAFKLGSWVYCSGCGLIRTRNPLTEWCIDKGCNYREHPGYRHAVHKFTDPWRKR